jgi:hypothetical protein
MVTSSRVRSALFEALSKVSPASCDGLQFPEQTSLAVRMAAFPASLLLRLNETVGRPLAPKSELDKRETARARLSDLQLCKPTASPVSREQAPVSVYFEGDRNLRERARIEELLKAKGVAYAMIDVTGDDAALAFARSKANSALVASDVAGTFQNLLFPLSAPVTN